MTYRYRAQQQNPRAIASTLEGHIKQLAAKEAHMKDRIGRLHRIEHLHRPRDRKNNQAQRTLPGRTMDQVLEAARPILAALQIDHPTPPGTGAERMRQFLAEEDAHRQTRRTA